MRSTYFIIDKRPSVFVVIFALIVLWFSHKSNADMYLDLGYGLSKPFSDHFGNFFFGGLVTGIRYDIAFRDSRIVEFGLGYVQRGGKDHFWVNTLNMETNLNGWSVFQYDYLRIPVVFKFRNPQPKVIRPSFFLGPRLDIRLNFKEHIDFIKNDSNSSGGRLFAIPAEDRLNWVVFGVTTGFEFEPFFRSLFGPTLRVGMDVDVTPLSKPANDYIVKVAFDVSGGIVFRNSKMRK